MRDKALDAADQRLRSDLIKRKLRRLMRSDRATRWRRSVTDGGYAEVRLVIQKRVQSLRYIIVPRTAARMAMTMAMIRTGLYSAIAASMVFTSIPVLAQQPYTNNQPGAAYPYYGAPQSTQPTQVAP